MSSENKITAAMVKELRGLTDAPMMDCKRALQEAEGDMEIAKEKLFAKGMAKAGKRASRVAADGVISIAADKSKAAVMLEVNCETDFVGKDKNFTEFVQLLNAAALDNQLEAVDALMALEHESKSFEDLRCELVAKLGENIQVRRMAMLQAGDNEKVTAYLHGVRIGVLVCVRGGDDSLGKDIAMHIAAMNPLALNEESMDAEVVSKERALYLEQAAESGKPADIVEKMVDGRIKKYLKENTLVHQQFVKDPDLTVANLLKQHDAEVVSFVRFELAEGIEKEEKDFAQEVMEQLK